MADVTLIAQRTRVNGRVHGDQNVDVAGHVDGSVELSEVLTVLDGGRVDGEVDVRQAIIHGTVTGAVRATELIHLAPTARVSANLSAPNLRIDDGAKLSGRIQISADGTVPARPAARTKTSNVAAAPKTTTTPAPVKATTTTTQATTPSTPAPSTSNPSRATPHKTFGSSAEAAPATQTTTTTTTVVVEEPALDEDTIILEQPPVEPTVEQEPTPEQLDPDQTVAINPDAQPLPSADTDDAFRARRAEELEEHTVKELREMLRDRDETVSGTKAELIERIIEHELNER